MPPAFEERDDDSSVITTLNNVGIYNKGDNVDISDISMGTKNSSSITPNDKDHAMFEYEGDAIETKQLMSEHAKIRSALHFSLRYGIEDSERDPLILHFANIMLSFTNASQVS